MHILVIILWIFIWIAILLFSITVHELGHFLALKKMKVYVHEFSIGFGPKLFSWGKKETKYYLRAIPLGGYVIGASKLAADVFPDVQVPKARLIDSMSYLKKTFFVFAGIGMNIVFALIMSLFYFAVQHHIKGNYGDFLLNGLDSFFVSMKALFTGHSVSIASNIKTVSHFTFGASMAFVLFLIVFTNFNLAILNVIPFPPLDGWKGAEFTYESITKKEISEKTKIIFAYVGISILLLFTIFSFIAPYLHL